MGKFEKGIFSLLLAGCALGPTVSLTAQADNGIIVITRDVQPRMATRAPVIPDPNPTTVNANPSQYVLHQTNELSDGDFANVASGAGITRLVNMGGANLGTNISTQNQLANQPAGRSAGGGNGIANMVNSSVQQGMGALKIITGGQ